MDDVIEKLFKCLDLAPPPKFQLVRYLKLTKRDGEIYATGIDHDYSPYDILKSTTHDNGLVNL